MAVVWLAVASLLGGVVGKDPTLGATPQMGFNSWNQLGCNYNETRIRAVADAMVNTGLAKLGYEYLSLDDCWMDKERDANGEWQFDLKRFPSGGQAIIDYVHSKGLKFGLYSSAGPKTCQGLPASLGKETIDANTIAKWGVDYLKYDNCGSEGISESEQEGRVKKMGEALTATGHHIFYSLCEWNGHRGNPFDWVKSIGNSWRTNGDISAHWDSVLFEADNSDTVWHLAGPHGWNDADMLEVGVRIGSNPPQFLTDEESRSHFSLWCLMKAPLLMGADTSRLTQVALSILSNKEAIAINQDPLGVQGHKMKGGPAVHPMAGNNIEMYSCNTSKAPQHIGWVSGRLQVSGTQLCLGVSKDLYPSTNKPYIELQTCSSATSQQFHNGSNNEIIHTPTSQCIEIAWGKQDQGAVVELNSCNGATDEQWITDGPLIQSVLNKYNCLTPTTRVPTNGDIWYGPLANGDVAVILLNRDGPAKSISCILTQVGIKSGSATVRDLWQHKNVGAFHTTYTATVPEHGVAFVRMSPM